MYRERREYYKRLENLRQSKLLVYITGDRPGLETQIHSEVLDYLTNHLDIIQRADKISMYLYTRGGNINAAWSIVNLIRQFCDEFEVIIPSKALSAGTLLSLGANKIVMTKQATLGPIDPSVNTPLNPQIPGAGPHARVSVSVEAIKGFITLAKEEFNLQSDSDLTPVLMKLADMVHPLVLGEVYRARSQIQMLARRLLSQQIKDEQQIKAIISFLCSDSGSHEYTISRREAKDQLGLNIEKPDENLYSIIRRIYDDINEELELHQQYDPKSFLGNDAQKPYFFKRALIESVDGGSDFMVSEGILSRTPIEVHPGVTQLAIEDKRLFEGWRHEIV